MTDTVSALENRFIHRPDVFVGGDMLMYYRMNDNTTRIAPDVFVVFEARGKHIRDSWLVWREGKAPDFVMEVASPSTWQRDIGEKRTIYAEMGVPEYWRFDHSGEFYAPALAGERLIDGECHPIPLHTDGEGILRGRSAVLGLDICVKPGLELRLYDPESEQWLRTHQESEEALLAAEAGRRAAEADRQSAEADRRAAEAGRRAAEAGRRAAEEEAERLREKLRNLHPGSPRRPVSRSFPPSRESHTPCDAKAGIAPKPAESRLCGNDGADNASLR